MKVSYYFLFTMQSMLLKIIAAFLLTVCPALFYLSPRTLQDLFTIPLDLTHDPNPNSKMYLAIYKSIGFILM